MNKMIDWDKENLHWTKEVPFTKESVQSFTKTGVYKLINKDNEIVYIGSAYGQSLMSRLNNYFAISDKGCSLRKKIGKEGKSPQEIDDYFATLRVSICEYNDLEMYLIKKYMPVHNRAGKK